MSVGHTRGGAPHGLAAVGTAMAVGAPHHASTAAASGPATPATPSAAAPAGPRALVQLDCIYTLGMQGNIMKNIAYNPNQELMFPAGRHVSVVDIHSNSMSFIQMERRVKEIQVLSVSPNGRYMALAQKLFHSDIHGESVAGTQVTIINLLSGLKLGVLATPEMMAAAATETQPVGKDYVGLCFSADSESKYIATVRNEPDHMIHYWNWRGKQGKRARSAEATKRSYSGTLLGCVRVGTKVDKISFNPRDRNLLVTTGPKNIKFYRVLKDLSLKLTNNLATGKKDYENYTDHCWVDDQLLVSSGSGEIFVFSDEGRLEHSVPPVNSSGGVDAVSCIITHKEGFIAGGSYGYFGIFRRSGDRQYVCDQVYRANADCHLASMCISTQEHEVAVFCRNTNTIFTFPFKDIPSGRLRSGTITAGATGGADFGKAAGGKSELFRPLNCGSATSPVTGLDVCPQKPIIALTSKDHTLSIFNYVTREFEVVKILEDEPLCVSLHPSGFHIAVGFAKKISFYTVVHNDIELCADFSASNVTQIRFSTGGQYFAASDGSSVQIFSTYSFSNLYTLHGAPASSSHSGAASLHVRDITWSLEDTFLSTVSSDGVLSQWELAHSYCTRHEMKENYEWKYTGVRYGKVRTVLIATCSCKNAPARFRILRGDVGEAKEEYFTTPSHAQPRAGAPPPNHEDSEITSLCLANNESILVGALRNGAIRAYLWPLQDKAPVYDEYALHNGNATAIKLSYDDSLLFTVGADGRVFISSVTIRADAIIPRRPTSHGNFNNVIILKRTDYQNMVETIRTLEAKLDDMTQAAKRTERLNQEAALAASQKMKEDFELDKRQLEQQFSIYKHTQEQIQLTNQTRMETIEESHLQAAEELENLYEKRLAAEAARFATLVYERDDMKCRYEERISTLISEHLRENERVSARYQQKIEALEEKVREQARGQQQDQAEHDLVAKMNEHERDLERERVRERTRHDTLSEVDVRVKKETEALTCERDQLFSTIDDLRKKVDFEQKSHVEHLTKIKIFQKELEDSQAKNKLLSDTIVDNTQKIDRFKSHVRELDKFKFVLNTKVDNLRETIDPNMRKIDDLTSMCEELRNKEDKSKLQEKALKARITSLETNNKVSSNQITQMGKTLTEKQRLIESLLREIMQLTEAHEKINPAELKEVYQKYQKKDRSQADQNHPDNMFSSSRSSDWNKHPRRANTELASLTEDGEFARQREANEKTKDVLKKMVQNTKREADKTTSQKVLENSDLIHEINLLRRANRELSEKLRSHDQRSAGMAVMQLAAANATAAASGKQTLHSDQISVHDSREQLGASRGPSPRPGSTKTTSRVSSAPRSPMRALSATTHAAASTHTPKPLGESEAPFGGLPSPGSPARFQAALAQNMVNRTSSPAIPHLHKPFSPSAKPNVKYTAADLRREEKERHITLLTELDTANREIERQRSEIEFLKQHVGALPAAS